MLSLRVLDKSTRGFGILRNGSFRNEGRRRGRIVSIIRLVIKEEHSEEIERKRKPKNPFEIFVTKRSFSDVVVVM